MPTPVPAARRMRPPPSSSWPPSQLPPNATQAMYEASWRGRPAPVSTSAPSTSVSVLLPAVGSVKDSQHWPEKMKAAHRFLTRDKDWGEEWQLCMGEWVEVQHVDGFQIAAVMKGKAAGAFASSTRPGLISAWINNKRVKDPDIADLPEYTRAWWAWWAECQPAGRSVDAKGRPTGPLEGFDWSCVDVTTSTGLVLVLAGLSIWGKHIFSCPRPSAREQKEWRDAVVDVSAVLHRLHLHKAARAGTPSVMGLKKKPTKRKSELSQAGPSRPSKKKKT